MLTQQRPVVYQEVGGQRRLISSHYVLVGKAAKGAARLRIALGRYNHHLPLVIDPTLLYATYLGGNHDEGGRNVVLDGSGNLYATGYTTSTNFPTVSPLQSALSGPQDMFVAKVPASGGALSYATYLGGSDYDLAQGIAVDSGGAAYVVGWTWSTNFPTAGAEQGSKGGMHDAVVSKLNAAGSALVYSTYLGGSADDFGHGIALDQVGNVYLTGYTASTNFPTADPEQASNAGSNDAFVATLSANLGTLLAGTYLGGSGDDQAYSVAVDEAGDAIVVGDTSSTDFPVTGGAIQSTNHGGRDAFVAKLSPIVSTRTITYTYDGLQRLTGATESPGSSFAYSYDLAGNRTGVTVNGTPILTNTYDAADQVVGWTYDNAGNLTSDGVTSYSYDATNDLTGTTTTGQSRAYTYNGDGTLVGQTANGTTANYTQDLASAQSQILAATTGVTTTDYLYGQDIAPLVALSGGTRTWYGIDGHGSVRQSLDDSGNVLGVANYDPFGQIEAGASLIGPFGYTGELQDPTTGQEYLRARWYQPGSGTLLGVDPLLDVTGQPYSYAYDNPINGSDPSGLDCGFLTFLQGNCRLPTPQEAAATWQNEVRPETYSAAVSVAGFYDSATNGAFSLLTGLVGVNIPQDCEADYQEGQNIGLAYNVVESLLSGGTDEAADASLAARFPRLLGVVGDGEQSFKRLAEIRTKLEELKNLDIPIAYQEDLDRVIADLAELGENPSQEELNAFLGKIDEDFQTVDANIRASAPPEGPVGQVEVTVVADAAQIAKATRRAKAEAENYAEIVRQEMGNSAPRTVSVAVSTATGEVYIGQSGHGIPLARLEKYLKEALPKLNREKPSVENCAEVQACNRALLAGENPTNLIYWSVSVRTGIAKPACRNCQEWIPVGQTPFGRKP